MPQPSRRHLLMAGASLGLFAAAPVKASTAKRTEPFPLEAVTLKDSIWKRAVDRNAQYLIELEPDRFLHNFRTSAGLPPKGAVYGGWEAMGIAGHSLGHYMSACSLMLAQTHDARFRQRIDYMVDELAACQAAHGDGYVGGTTVDRDGKTVDGKIVFEEVRAHTISSHGFDLNGGWVPLYTWHKVHQGLLDAHLYADNAKALDVAVKMSDYLIGVLGGLSDAEMQQVLACEHGGLNETFAETYARTGQKRFLAMSERLYHKAILTPLSQGRDELAGKHANTQIPKLIGLARLYEVTGETGYHDTSSFFWDTVVHHHSYVIGGNADSEHFGPADVISPFITDKTCEGCNSYNMLKLTRHLYQWVPDAKWFDYYERTHLNHIMAQQDPDTGLFVYFMPLYPGSQRVYSTKFDSFWCCVGTGMESHAKHGDSIYWRNGDTVFVNLFIPSRLNWTDKRTKIDLDTRFPDDETVTFTVNPPAHGAAFELAVRLPGWCAKPRLSLNGKAVAILPRDGYARLNRRWKTGDTVVLTLPQSLRFEATPDDARRIAYLKGPMVMAADMGAANTSEAPRAPVLVGNDALAVVEPATLMLNAQPQALPLKPYYAQYHRRSAAYFPLFTAEQWRTEEAAWTAKEAAQRELEARTIDDFHFGEMQPERDHGFDTDIGEVTSRAGRAGRWIMWTSGKYMAFDMKAEPGAILQITYWGQDTHKSFDIEVNGKLLTHETLAFDPVSDFRTVDYALLPDAIQGGKVHVRFVTRNSDLALFEARTLRPAATTSV